MDTAPDPSQPYVGRYAPSPTGRLHGGNLLSAALAWADARAAGGRFLMRMEDLDTPRVVPGAAAQILWDLEALGLDWDGPVVYQSERIPRYEAALEALVERGEIFPCRCSRRDIQEAASAPHGPEGPIYPGTCRGLPSGALLKGGDAVAWRLRLPEGLGVEGVWDRRLGAWREDLRGDVGDFVLRRKDGIVAYQFACVFDDLMMGVTDVVRGEDLIGSCGRQQHLARVLGGDPPRWLHLPLVKNEGGEKLSKRDRAWDPSPLDGPVTLGALVATLGWIPPGAALSAPDLLALYRGRMPHPFGPPPDQHPPEEAHP